MAHLRYTSQEISQRGKAWYERAIRPQIDEESQKGKALVIDIETGDYELDDEGLDAAHRLLAKRADAPLYWMRVGYPAYAKIGGWRRLHLKWRA